MRGKRPSQVSVGEECTHPLGSTSEFPTQQALCVRLRVPPLSPVALPALRLVQYRRRVPYRSKMLAISKKKLLPCQGITFGPRSCDLYLSEEGGSSMSERWVIVTRADAPGLLLLRLQQCPDKHPEPLECHPPSHSPPSSPPHTRRWSIFSRAHCSLFL